MHTVFGVCREQHRPGRVAEGSVSTGVREGKSSVRSWGQWWWRRGGGGWLRCTATPAVCAARHASVVGQLEGHAGQVWGDHFCWGSAACWCDVTGSKLQQHGRFKTDPVPPTLLPPTSLSSMIPIPRICTSNNSCGPSHYTDFIQPQIVTPSPLNLLRRSSKVAVALAAGGLVPPLLEPLMAAVAGPPGRAAAAASSAPILRAKLLDIISIMYQHHPRPKEFIMKYRIQV